MRSIACLVMLFVLLGVAPAEAQLFRKIFSKSGGRDPNSEQQNDTFAAPAPTPVPEQRAIETKPVPVAPDTVLPDKPEKSNPTSGLGKRETASGFRIQIYNGPNRADAMRLKQEMESSYPDMKVHFLYRQPNFRVRIGDFRNQRDAELLLPQFRQLGYKTSFVVPDEIFVEP